LICDHDFVSTLAIGQGSNASAICYIMISRIYQEIVLPFHCIFVGVQAHAFRNFIVLAALVCVTLALWWLSIMMLTKPNHALIERNFRSSCIHIHLLILRSNLQHLILLEQDLLLQIDLTVLVLLRVLS